MKEKIIEKAKKDIMEIFNSYDGELKISEVLKIIDHRHGEILVGEALSELEKEGKLIRRRYKSNLYTYSTK
jgi:hypothetical protein